MEATFGVLIRDPARLATESLWRYEQSEGTFSWWNLLDLAAELGGRFESKIDEVVFQLERSRLDECRAALEALSKGREPKHEWCTAMDDEIIRTTPAPILDALRSQQGNVGAAFRRVFRTRSSAGSVPTVFLFVGGESRTLDWVPPQEQDRYVSLLRCLLARVSEAVRRASGEDSVVRLHVLSRDVLMGREWSDSFELNERALASLVQDVRKDVPDGARLEVAEVRRYTLGAHPAYVMADFAAHATLPELHGHLWKVMDRMENNIGAPLKSGTPNRPHLVAAGWAWANRDDRCRLQSALTGTKSPDGASPRPWALEQAILWAPEEEVAHDPA